MQDAAVIGVVLFVPSFVSSTSPLHAWHSHAFAEDLRRADAEEHPRAYIVPAAAAPLHTSSSKSGTVSIKSGNGINTNTPRIDADISPLLADILESTNKKLAPFKRITGGIMSVDAIPKNAVSCFLLLPFFFHVLCRVLSSLSPPFIFIRDVSGLYIWLDGGSSRTGFGEGFLCCISRIALTRRWFLVRKTAQKAVERAGEAGSTGWEV